MELWLARHGTTEANLEGRFQGRLDFPLSAKGYREADCLAEHLKAAPPDRILCSDLRRARQTAQIIAARLGLTVEKTPLLRECSWGIIEGLTRDEIRSCYPSIAASLDGGGKRPFIPGAEGKRRLKARCLVLLKMIGRRFYLGERLLLVSHGCFLNAFVSTSLGLKPRERWPYSQNPASLTILKLPDSSGSFKLALFNYCCHLEGSLPGRLDRVN